MAATTEMISTWENQVLESVRQSQDAVVKVVGMWAEAGGNLIPKPLPLPYSDQIPAPAELVEQYFQYSAKLLNTQKEFVDAVLDAARPVLSGNGAPAKR
jgi:hypothetical protein